LSLQIKCISDNSPQWTLRFCSQSLTVQLRTLLLRHSTGYAADCVCKQSSYCYMCCSTQCWRDTLSVCIYKQI